MEGNFTVVVISFKTDTDQTLWSSEVEEEREKLLESVSMFYFAFLLKI